MISDSTTTSKYISLPNNNQIDDSFENLLRFLEYYALCFIYFSKHLPPVFIYTLMNWIKNMERSISFNPDFDNIEVSDYNDVSSETTKTELSYINGLAEIQEDKLTEDEIPFRIVAEFVQIDEVESIYMQKFDYELEIAILLSIDKYDDELIDKLLDIEYALQNEIEEPLLSFSYIPKIYNDKSDILHPNNILIFER